MHKHFLRHILHIDDMRHNCECACRGEFCVPFERVVEVCKTTKRRYEMRMRKSNYIRVYFRDVLSAPHRMYVTSVTSVNL